MKHLVVTILICISLFSCSKTTLEPGPLRGVWVETSQRQDTISFLEFDPDKYLTLDRGREIRNGYLLPKPGSGPYDYVLKNDSIDLRAGWSNSLSYQTYYFKFDPQHNLIQIGNFYDDSKNAAAILSFTKLY
jgi:hypothetical protein